MLTQPLTNFIASLKDEFARDMAGPNVLGMLENYVQNNDDWQKFAMFRPDGSRYARNLLERNEMFELLILCWGPGQQSPIHNHEGQNCWMAILEGAIEEVYYEFPAGTGQLPQKGDPCCYSAGQAGYICDDIALHLIRPANGERAVSLHLYSRPFGECNLYCPDTGNVDRCKLGYYSIEGELTAA